MTPDKKPTPPQRPADKPVEAETLRGEALQERAAELDIQGRSSMHADELREAIAEEVATEGAPKLETPEAPTPPPEDTPRDEEPRMETPEEPAKPPKEAAETKHTATTIVAALAKPKARTFDQTSPTVASLVVTLGGGPGPSPAVVVSNDEAAMIAAQHNL